MFIGKVGPLDSNVTTAGPSTRIFYVLSQVEESNCSRYMKNYDLCFDADDEDTD